MNLTRRRTFALLAMIAPGARAHQTGSPRDPVLDRLLDEAEAALAAGDSSHALDLFESAGNLSHGAAAELGAARCMMQMGQYGNAAALAAHIAGVHWRETGGTAFYAWLLHLGGQSVAARALLARQRALLPEARVLAATESLLSADHRLPQGELLDIPARLAPVAVGAQPTARTVATGILLEGGAVVSAAMQPAWATPHALRDHTGRCRALLSAHALPGGHAVRWRIDRVLPTARAPIAMAPGAPFPGALWHCVAHVGATDGEPAWPRLTVGFYGPPAGDSPERALHLGRTLAAGAEGAPLWDRQGRLAALATRNAAGDWLAIPVTSLGLELPRGDAGGPPVPLESLYESALTRCVQVLAA